MLKDINYLIYSSHKTSTQSLLKLLIINNFKCIHCHNLSDLSLKNKELKGLSSQKLKKYFLENLIKYKKTNCRKLTIISIIRNPIDRLLSSFFQSFHSDEVYFHKKREEETTITKLNETELYNLYINKIINDVLPGRFESVDEMASVFDIDIIKNLKKCDGYYYFENDLIKLYVLDFNKTISENNLDYLNKVLGLKLKENGCANLTKNKSYYDKYENLKRMIPSNIKSIIVDRYENFYFNAFNQFCK